MTDARRFTEAVGSQIYLSTCTRPDISFVVSKLSQHFAEPILEHWITVKRVQVPERYSRTGVMFQKKLYTGLRVYINADWASEVTAEKQIFYQLK